MPLSDTELDLAARAMNTHGRVDLDAMLVAPARAMLVESSGDPVWLWPGTKLSVGWRIWKLSGLEFWDFVRIFDRRTVTPPGEWSLERAIFAGGRLRAEARRRGIPIVALGTKPAWALEHDLATWTWNIGWGSPAPLGAIVKIPHPHGKYPAHRSRDAKDQTRATLRQALEIGRCPPFEVADDIPQPCGRVASAHDPHPTRPELRVVCPADRQSGAEVVLPWGGPLAWVHDLDHPWNRPIYQAPYTPMLPPKDDPP